MKSAEREARRAEHPDVPLAKQIIAMIDALSGAGVEVVFRNIAWMNPSRLTMEVGKAAAQRDHAEFLSEQVENLILHATSGLQERKDATSERHRRKVMDTLSQLQDALGDYWEAIKREAKEAERAAKRTATAKEAE